jgi:hypothetical protein
MRMCGDGYVGPFPLFIINMRTRTSTRKVTYSSKQAVIIDRAF